MKRDNNKIMHYKFRRDNCRENGNLFLESFYQMRIVREIENRRFYLHKKSDLEQHWQILYSLLDRALGIGDEGYQKGIYYEVALSDMGILLSGEEKECQIYRSFVERSENVEYVDGAYQIHINGILEIAKEDADAAGRYAHNLLTLLNMRYGIDSRQFARMKLYITGKYYHMYKKDLFLAAFQEDYDYFRQYTADNDFNFCRILILYTLRLGEDGDKDYELWMDRCEDVVGQWQGDESYPFLQCEIAWAKAKVLKKQNRDGEALGLLQEAITDYLERDSGDKELFYGYVYLMAACICYETQAYALMLHYTQKGLAMCEELNLVGSELYYNLYHGVGLFHILKQSWGEAEKLYSNCIRDIEERFGKESENYAIYMGQLVCIALRQGKSADAYLKEIKGIKDEKLRKKVKAAFDNELNQAIVNGESIRNIQKIYRACVSNMDEEEDRQERERLDVLYLAAMAQAVRFEAEFDSLMQKLSENYRNDFTGELGITYWGSIVLWEWWKGNTQDALRISERISRENTKTENQNMHLMAVYYAQLLIINGQYDKAKELIITQVDRLGDLILEIGFGNSFSSLFIMRIFLSMYIYMFLTEGDSWQSDASEAELLLEKVIRCKTIEREVKGLLGKAGMDEYVYMHYFRQTHRRLAALHMGRKKSKLKDYERKRMQCLLEMAEYEADLNQRIPFHELIREFRFEEIRIPEDAVCLEFFAYYNFCTDGPMIRTQWEDDSQEIYSYLVFVLSEDAGQVKISDIINIPLDVALENKENRLLDAAEHTNKYETGEIDEIVQHLNRLYAAPFLKYFEENKKAYLGLDYILQMLPVDLIFCNRRGEPVNTILADSVRYVGEDTRINMEESDALIIGNPQVDSQDMEYERLPSAELESKEIAGMFGTKAYVGKEAKQSLLWRREAQDVIHISSHGGLVEESPEEVIKSNLFTDSYLAFAGYRDWEEGRRNREYGNGIVSGDDFLFMDLSKTKLVVLSACVSGLGYTKGLQNIHGMRWALGTAGAENSVSTLWSVSEEATAVLMVLFYRNLYSMPVGEALYEAKKRLRTITIGELRKDSVLKQMMGIAEKGQEADDRPYQHWRYWAAFVCYHR